MTFLSSLRPSLSLSRRILHQSRYLSSAAAAAKVCIVGSGPSGCYTAKYLNSPKVQIDILDRLPTPFGLVRSGVAPDHPEVKNVQNDFSELFESSDNNIRFFGNVSVGSEDNDISLQDLRAMYDAVVLAYGCESDRKLNIEGASLLEGIMSAREFVAFYNGHPDYVHVGDSLKSVLCSKEAPNNVVVIGQGNVALDCARVLAKGSEGLLETDIASHALPILRDGIASTTTVLGRRGHVQGAFTIKELRELTKLEQEGHDTSFVVLEEELNLGATESSFKELEDARPKKRIDKLLRDAAAAQPSADKNPKQVALRFLLNPIRFEPSPKDSTKLGAVVCERTRLEGKPGQQVAVGIGELHSFPADMCLVSVGYKGVAIDGLEDFFDEQRGVVVHEHGKVDDTSGSRMGGLYVAGWLKRGPIGIIGTNIADAKDTVASIRKDLESQELKTSDEKDDLAKLLKDRKVQYVDWDAYRKIDAVETSLEQRRNSTQPREKLTSINDLLAAAFGTTN